MEYDRNKLIYHDQPEQIWVRIDEDCLLSGDVKAGYVSAEAAEAALGEGEATREVTLHRPSLRPVYGGPTLLEALWNEMDRLMEALMTRVENTEDVCDKMGCSNPASADRCRHLDNGDKYRAAELAWVIAIVTNAYAPSMDLVRKEAMERWDARQEEPA